MRRRTTLSLAFMLCAILAVGGAPNLAGAAQDAPGPFGEGITITEGPLLTRDSRTAAYSVLFNHGAYIDEEKSQDLTRDALVVKVLSGSFALRVQGDMIVDPLDQDIEILDAAPPIPYGDSVRMARDFTTNRVIANDSCPGVPPPVSATATPGKTLCLLNPTTIGSNEQFVKLLPGFAVYLPPNSECFFCNLSGNTGDDTSAANTADQAELLVWAPRSGFTWQSKSQQSMQPGTSTPSASAQDLHDAVGWTVLRNPGSPCH